MYFAVVMRASGNRRTMPDARLNASYQAYNGYRIGVGRIRRSRRIRQSNEHQVN
ncbi:hypothetical protein WRSd3_01514 [Shigella dysenteriae WRSd3]|uniref:Uncharacterized protein n=1 Tax=Shigella dysenteriae WRSd3 TaxID=1401327 RepID=A0A090NJG1_SHIDY|nr:hypothetical protein WRSd3_01514 [Shigella dysenteriae WRSd3]